MIAADEETRLEKEIREYEAEIASLQWWLREVETKHKAAESKLFGLRALRAPVTRASDDVLALIFEAGSFQKEPILHLARGISGLTPAEQPFQVVVSHVCRGWRSVAINRALLWSTISIRRPEDLQSARTWLARSKAAPLTLTIEGYAEDTRYDQDDPLVRLLRDLTPRLSRLTLLGPARFNGHILTQFPSSADVLEAIVVCNDAAIPGISDDSHEDWIRVRTPRLRRVHLRGLSVLPSAFLEINGLTHLSLTLRLMFGQPSPSLHNFFHMLLACPALSHLTVHDFQLMTSDPFAHVPMVQLPSLRQFAVSSRLDPQAIRALALMQMPLLEEFAMSVNQTQGAVDDGIRRLFEGMHHVRSLTLNMDSAQRRLKYILRALAEVSGNAPLLMPSLTHLTLDSAIYIGTPPSRVWGEGVCRAVVDMVVARRRTNRQLEMLSIDPPLPKEYDDQLDETGS